MLLNQLIAPRYQPLSIIRDRCSRFIAESNKLPLYKNLSTQYETIQKIKARKRNLSGQFADTFNTAFGDNLAQRAIFANGTTSYHNGLAQYNEEVEPYYVFPVDGYKYLYSTEVRNSSQDYKKVIETVFEQFGSEKGKTIVTDLLKFAYKQDQLAEGVESGAEIVFYDIPFYYAVKTTCYPNYNQLLHLMGF